MNIDNKFCCGQEVSIKHVSILGYITAIIVRDSNIDYEVTFATSDGIRTYCFSEYQIEGVK